MHGLLGGHAAPEVAVGLHHGPAVEHEGDYYGAAVNIAARVAALAASGEVLVTGTTAAVVPHLEGVIFEPRGRGALRNVRDPVELSRPRAWIPREMIFRLIPCAAWRVDDQRAAGRLVHEGEAYYFCSLTCAGAFANQPERFAGTRDTGSPS